MSNDIQQVCHHPRVIHSIHFVSKSYIHGWDCHGTSQTHRFFSPWPLLELSTLTFKITFLGTNISTPKALLSRWLSFSLLSVPCRVGTPSKTKRRTPKLLYFEWSPPWHVGWRLSGGGCHWEYDGKNGDFENIDFRFPWLSDTSEMGFGHDVPFLNYSDRLPHPSDLCQPDRVRWG